jgi:hypothetical protein
MTEKAIRRSIIYDLTKKGDFPMLKELTASQLKQILNLYDENDNHDKTGEYIAEEMLSGKIKFSQEEVEAIAGYMGMPATELAASDERFSVCQ